MILTDKCKADFEKWYEKTIDLNFAPPILIFNDIHPSMQYGVIVDFADSVGYYIVIEQVGYSNNNFYHQIKSIDGYFYSESATNGTRHEARTEAVKKFNEIYNSK